MRPVLALLAVLIALGAALWRLQTEGERAVLQARSEADENARTSDLELLDVRDVETSDHGSARTEVAAGEGAEGTATLRLLLRGIPPGLPVTWRAPRAIIEDREEVDSAPGVYLRATRPTPSVEAGSEDEGVNGPSGAVLGAEETGPGDRASELRGPSAAGTVHDGALDLVWRGLAPGPLEIGGLVRGYAGEAPLVVREVTLAREERAEITVHVGRDVDVMSLDVRGAEALPVASVTIGLSDGPTGCVFRCTRRTPGHAAPPPFVVVRERSAYRRLFVNAEDRGELILEFATGLHLLQLPEEATPLIAWRAPEGGTPADTLVFERDLPAGTWSPKYECELSVHDALDLPEGSFVPLAFPGPGRYRAREATGAIAPVLFDVEAGDAVRSIVLPGG
ncbi:MAG: hypothetical protein AAFU73_12535 [Planctomycetota bacterium]